MPIIRSGKEADFRPSREYVEILSHNGLPLIVYTDELWEESNGTLGRVSVEQTIEILTSLIDRFDDTQLTELVRNISQDRGIHSGRLELTMKHGSASSHEFAVAMLAHYFNVGAEVLLGLGTQDVFSRLAERPGNQGEGFKLRLLREGRLRQIQMWDLPADQVVHLLSDGTLFQVMR